MDKRNWLHTFVFYNSRKEAVLHYTKGLNKMKTYLSALSIVAISIVAFCGCSKDSSNEDSPKSGNIQFEDAVAKARLVKLYDLNSDAELSYSEAAAVTSLEKFSIDGLKYLDELKYFTAVTEIRVEESETLERISIPKNVISIRDFGTGDHGATKREFPRLKKITCYPTTPPSQAYRMVMNIYLEFDGEHLVYVPKESVSLYKNHILEEISNQEKQPLHEKLTQEEINSILNRIKGF